VKKENKNSKPFVCLYGVVSFIRKKTSDDLSHEPAIKEIILAIKDISVKHNLNTFVVAKMLPELSDFFMKRSKIDDSLEWR